MAYVITDFAKAVQKRSAINAVDIKLGVVSLQH